MEYLFQILIIIFFTFLAGVGMPIGAAVASLENIKPRWLEEEFRHSIIAFGGGALLSAVALVLVPEGIENLDPFSAVIYFCSGAVLFMALDILLFKLKTAASQFTAMLSDFIPESMALGAAFSISSNTALLLACLMALQNLPEGFNSYHELKSSTSYRRSKIICTFAIMTLLGPVAGVSGYLWLSSHPEIIGAIMLFAAGGILYSVFQDIAPQVKLKNHWTPPLGAIMGFVLGIVGYMLAVE